ncbi:hypothetical protein [Desulfonatronovibrio hydrogenovorans]|uniref:hypothetical protein n=1 Tax=Desulfonatronovibrio hydrogenovorans TaxID=53245 RepID=UPI000556AED8|nr:hypothetical protein [Desulfonatronovibrio hydrogenovorans]
MKKIIVPWTILFLLALLTHIPASKAQARTLQFFANGEELITEGFLAPKLTKDGWKLTFSHAFVSLSNITAYQADSPYDARSGQPVKAKEKVMLEGIYVIDLAAGAEDDPPVFVGEVKNAPTGHYNAISWKMARDKQGLLAGYTMLLTGVAEKDGTKVDFQIRTAEESTYTCGEFVGDERKGFLQAGGMADLEMTFHFDHIFGRADKDADDPMNLEAVGFEPFAHGSKVHEITLKGMHIGHAGEGHCSVMWH